MTLEPMPTCNFQANWMRMLVQISLQTCEPLSDYLIYFFTLIRRQSERIDIMRKIFSIVINIVELSYIIFLAFYCLFDLLDHLSYNALIYFICPNVFLATLK